MKQRWEKYISKTLDKFGVTTEELAERDVREGSEVGEDDETDGSLDVSTMRGYRGNANYYTNADDLKILDYIVQNKRFTDVGGNGMWEVGFYRFCLFTINRNYYLADGEEGSDTWEIFSQPEGEVQKSDHQEDQNLRSE